MYLQTARGQCVSDSSFVEISSKRRRSQTIRARDLTFLENVHHHYMSHVTCPVSHITCQLKQIYKIILEEKEENQIRRKRRKQNKLLKK